MMRLNPLFHSLFCMVVYFAAVVKSFPQEIADADTDLILPQVPNGESFAVSQADSNPPVPRPVSWRTDETHDTEGSTLSTNEQEFLMDEHLSTSFDINQIEPIGSPDETVTNQALQLSDCDSTNPPNAVKIKRGKSCVNDPDHPVLPKIPFKPIHDPSKKIRLHECPPDKFAFCCDHAQFDPATKSYGDCSNCSCPRTNVSRN